MWEQVRVLGDLSLLPEYVQRAAANAMRLSRHHTNVTLNICMAYTSRCGRPYISKGKRRMRQNLGCKQK